MPAGVRPGPVDRSDPHARPPPARGPRTRKGAEPGHASSCVLRVKISDDVSTSRVTVS